MDRKTASDNCFFAIFLQCLSGSGKTAAFMCHDRENFLPAEIQLLQLGEYGIRISSPPAWTGNNDVIVLLNRIKILCLGLLIAMALFRERIIEKTGMELFVSLILILSVSASYCIFQDKRWKANAVENLLLYNCFFAGMVRDLHQGIRIMLFESDTDFPLKSLLLEIQSNNPGISGIDLVKAAGRVLQFPELMNIYENNGSDILEKKKLRIQSERWICSTLSVFFSHLRSSWFFVFSCEILKNICELDVMNEQ